jgi:hypothetical protein
VDDVAVPDALRQLNFIFFDEAEQFEASADRLVEALQTDIAWVRRHTEFGDTAHRWVEAGRPGGMLLRPPVLDQAEAWLAFRPGGAPASSTPACQRPNGCHSGRSIRKPVTGCGSSWWVRLFTSVTDVILRNCERGYSFPEFIVCGGGMLAFSAFLFSVEIAKGRVQAYGNAYLFPRLHQRC